MASNDSVTKGEFLHAMRNTETLLLAILKQQTGSYELARAAQEDALKWIGAEILAKQSKQLDSLKNIDPKKLDPS